MQDTTACLQRVVYMCQPGIPSLLLKLFLFLISYQFKFPAAPRQHRAGLRIAFNRWKVSLYTTVVYPYVVGQYLYEKWVLSLDEAQQQQQEGQLMTLECHVHMTAHMH
jgi:hypothetical protein